jgi:hypothetical protein
MKAQAMVRALGSMTRPSARLLRLMAVRLAVPDRSCTTAAGGRADF